MLIPQVAYKELMTACHGASSESQMLMFKFFGLSETVSQAAAVAGKSKCRAFPSLQQSLLEETGLL